MVLDSLRLAVDVFEVVVEIFEVAVGSFRWFQVVPCFSTSGLRQPSPFPVSLG